MFLSGAMAFAAIWTPTMTTGTHETPLYVSVKVNGNLTSTGLEVAAFIDDECRAVATTAMQLGSGTTSTYAYRLRVWGTAADVNKTITIKAFYNNLVYRFTTTQIFDNESETHQVPIILNLDAVMGFTLTNPINIVANVPAVHDLTTDVSITYDEVNKKNESVLESALTYEWAPAAAEFSVTGNVLTADAVTPPDGLSLGLTVKGPKYGGSTAVKQYTFATTTQVIVTEPVIAVTGITLSPTSITAHIGDNYLTKINELVTVTMTPSSATDKSWNATIAAASTATVTTAHIIDGAGVLNVIISSASNPEVTANLTINVPTPVSFNFPAELTLSKLHATAVAFTNLVGDEFDKSLINIVFSNTTAAQPCATASMSDATGMNWNFTGQYVGDYTYQVIYNGVAMTSTTGGSAGAIHIPAEVALLNTGWEWISLYAYKSGQTSLALTNTSGDYLAWMNTDANNKVIEIRSQSALLYNDATWGFIGDITELSPAGGMYKVKAKYADASSCVLNLGSDCVPITSTTVSYNTIQTGYTWISYPLETATTIAETQLASNALSGDMIIGKTSSATFNGTTWLPADFTFQPGKGYIYYTAGGGGFRPNFNAPAGGGVKGWADGGAFGDRTGKPFGTNDGGKDGDGLCGAEEGGMVSPWKYDASAFADNMPVIAALEGLETGERFSIGAYVGDECRGEGRAVDGNIFIINVAGQSGELVHFRLYNKATGAFTDLDQSIIYTAMQGSLRAPVRLSGSGVVDGIQSVEQTPASADAMYNLAGQKVGKNYRGVVITNGRKVVK